MAVLVAGERAKRAVAVDLRAQILPPLVAVTLVAAAAELVLLRLTSRIGIHIPAMGWARDGYTVAVNAGNYAFPLAAVFAAGTLAALGLALLRRAPAPAVAALVLLGYQAWLLRAGVGATAVAVHELLLGGCLLAALLQAMREGWRRGPALLLALVVGAEVLGQLQAASANMAAGGGAALPVALVSGGEVVLLAALLLAPLLLAPPAWPRGALAAGVMAALLVGGALAGDASTARILALWTFGLAMPAPVPLYALAAAALTATAVAHVRASTAAVAAGLALVALGGFVPPNSYQADLLLAGVLVLAFPTVLSQREHAGASLR